MLKYKAFSCLRWPLLICYSVSVTLRKGKLKFQIIGTNFTVHLYTVHFHF